MDPLLIKNYITSQDYATSDPISFTVFDHGELTITVKGYKYIILITIFIF